MGRITNHVHVWLSLLERAGFRREDIPNEWEPFWSFWCDTVQPAVRKALGRQDVWAVGAPMSARSTIPDARREFVYASRGRPTPTGPSLLRDPAARAALVKGLAGYTALWRKGCTPPDAIDWTNPGNNEAFLAQRVVMTVNPTLSIPSALRATRPDDYYRNAITIGWPKDAFGRPEHIDDGDYRSGADGRPLAIMTRSSAAVVFKAGGHVAAAKEFVHFLVGEGWLAHWLDFAGDRFLPPMPALLEQPFWLDPGDPHRMTSAMQFLARRPRLRLRGRLRRVAAPSGEGGARLAEGDPPQSCRRPHLRAGGRRGDRARPPNLGE